MRNALALAALALWGCGTATPAPCAHALDCAAGTTCIDGACTPTVACATSRACPGLVCDLTRGACVECVTRSDCFDGADCVGGVCEPPLACAGARDCSIGLVCDTARGLCVMCNTDVDCRAGEACRADHTCGAALDASRPDAGAIDGGARDTGIDAPEPDAFVPGDAGHVDANVDAFAPDASPGPCDPRASPDLWGWYVGDLGVTSDPSGFTWADQGPGHNDLTGPPAVTVVGAPNGHSAVALSSGSLGVACTSCPAWDARQPLVVAVAYQMRAPAMGTIWSRGAGVRSIAALTHPTDTAYDVVFAGDMGGVPAALSIAGAYEVLVFYADGAGRVDVLVNTHLAFTRDTPITHAFFVDGALSMGPFEGTIAEMVVLHPVDGSVPATDPRCVMAYLMSRYGISP